MFPHLLTQLQLPMVDMPPACPHDRVRRNTNSICLFVCLFVAFICLLVCHQDKKDKSTPFWHFLFNLITWPCLFVCLFVVCLLFVCLLHLFVCPFLITRASVCSRSSAPSTSVLLPATTIGMSGPRDFITWDFNIADYWPLP